MLDDIFHYGIFLWRIFLEPCGQVKPQQFLLQCYMSDQLSFGGKRVQNLLMRFHEKCIYGPLSAQRLQDRHMLPNKIWFIPAFKSKRQTALYRPNREKHKRSNASSASHNVILITKCLKLIRKTVHKSTFPIRTTVGTSRPVTQCAAVRI